MVMINDMIELSGALPTAGTTLTTAAGDLVDLDEALDFSLSTPTQIVAGDTVIIDGTLYTVTLMIDAKAMVTYDGGASTAAVTAHGITLDDGSGGTLSYLIPADDGGDLPDITQIEIQSVNTAANIQVSEVDGNEDVTLDIPPDYIVEGTSGADTIDAAYMGDPEGDQIDNNDGNPLQPGPAGGDNDSVEAGAGDDSVSAGLGDDTVLGEAGNDTLFGGIGDDSLDGGSGDDTLHGGSGNDSIDLTADGASAATVGRWDFDDNSDPLDDAATPDNDAILRGDAAHDTATGAIDLDGSGDYVEIADDPAYDLTSATIVMDFRLDTLTGITGLFTKDAVNNAEGDLTAYVNTDGSIFLRWQSDTTNYTFTTSSGVIQTGVDHELHVSLDNDTGDIELYVDGTLEGSVNAPGATLDGNVNPWVVGARGWGSTRGTADNVTNTMDGSVSLFEVFDDAYTPPELEQLGDGDVDTIVFSDGDGHDTVTGFEGPIDNGDGTFTGQDQLDLSGLTDTGGQQLNTRDITVGDDGFGNAVLSFPNGESITLVGIAPSEVSDEDALAAMGVLAPDDIVEGTAGADTIDVNYTGDPEGDAVDAGDNAAGNDDDVITAGDGDDYVSAALGDDTVLGEAGNDTLTGGVGNDSLVGGIGHDSIVGGSGDDTIDGGDGNDTINTSIGSDLVSGGDGDDFITGAGDDATSNDTMAGGAGDDTLIGGLGDDSLTGDTGDDVFVLGQDDTGIGGDGDDTFYLADYVEPGAGTIDITGGEGAETTGDTLYLGPDVSFGDITFTNTDDLAGGLSGSFAMVDGTVVTFSEIENIICFTPGTRILTQHGERPIETLQLGDMVVTRDHGLRPIRWIGKRTVPGKGRFAPIRVGTKAVDGARTGLLVSPQHRILFTGYKAELLFGETEVLVPAKHLIDGHDVVQADQDQVTYIHLMFDHHEVIYAEGIAAESFHPGDVGLSAVCEAAREELFAIFPELRTAPGGHLKTARPCLKKFEAQLLADDITGPTILV